MKDKLEQSMLRDSGDAESDEGKHVAFFYRFVEMMLKGEERRSSFLCLHVVVLCTKAYIYLLVPTHPKLSSGFVDKRRRRGKHPRMEQADPPTTTTQVTHEETSDDQPSQVTAPLDPPTTTTTLSFIPTPSNNLLRPSTGRTSITQVELDDDDEQLLAPEPTTTSDVAAESSSTSNAANTNTLNQTSAELISKDSQDQPQSVQQPSTSSTQQPQTTASPQTVPQMPLIYLTFLLISGRRRTMSFEPESPIGRVKELAWNSWPTGQSLQLTFLSIN